MDKFEFSRSRGIVWVCDLASSSKLLNDNTTADELETFLPRLYCVGIAAVEAAGGKFIKWTGDGFIGWFELPLHRELGSRMSAVCEAVWQLTFLVNVTQLGVKASKNFRIRHGVTYEQDALLTKITHVSNHESLDLTGRSVVLAFRLSGIEAPFPNLITQKELANAYKDCGGSIIQFVNWSPSQEEKLKYFKNEKWGTSSLYTSGKKKQRKKNLTTVIRRGKQAVLAAEGNGPHIHPNTGFADRFFANLSDAPPWCTDVVAEHVRFIKDDLLGSLKQLLDVAEKKVSETQRTKHDQEHRPDSR